MIDLWMNLPANTQDIIIFFLCLVPGILIGRIVTRGYQLGNLLKAILWRHRWTNLLFTLFLAVSVGLSIALIAQERGLRSGMARVADKFDLIVSAPGSRIDMMLATVFLQPSDAPLLDGKTMQSLLNEPKVTLAAPIAYGDSYRSYPIIGSTADFVQHLSGGLQKGQIFQTTRDAIVGARVNLEIGDRFKPAHGISVHSEDDEESESGHADDNHSEEEHDENVKGEPDHLEPSGHHRTMTLKVAGKMPLTGSPWDKAIIVAVESVWEVHGLNNGHSPLEAAKLGPPFDPEFFPGTPAVIVRSKNLWANYDLASRYTTDNSMAFFPGTVLAKLNEIIGDIRKAMSILSTISQVMMAACLILGLTILARLFSRRFALLRALGAPRRYIFALMWSYTASLVVISGVIGIFIGIGTVSTISRVVTALTDIYVNPKLDWPEFHLVALYFSITVLLATIPAFMAYKRSPVKDLRKD